MIQNMPVVVLATLGRITIAVHLTKMTTTVMIILGIIKRMANVVVRAMVHRVRMTSLVVVKMACVVCRRMHAAMGVSQILVPA